MNVQHSSPIERDWDYEEEGSGLFLSFNVLAKFLFPFNLSPLFCAKKVFEGPKLNLGFGMGLLWRLSSLANFLPITLSQCVFIR